MPSALTAAGRGPPRAGVVDRGRADQRPGASVRQVARRFRVSRRMSTPSLTASAHIRFAVST